VRLVDLAGDLGFNHSFLFFFVAKLLGVVSDDKHLVVKVLLFLRQLAVVLAGVLQVEELHKSEVLQVAVLVLEKRVVKLFVPLRPQPLEQANLKNCVSVVVLTDAVLVFAEQFDNGLEEVRANVSDGLRRVLETCRVAALALLRLFIPLLSLVNFLFQLVAHFIRQLLVEAAQFFGREVDTTRVDRLDARRSLVVCRLKVLAVHEVKLFHWVFLCQIDEQRRGVAFIFDDALRSFVVISDNSIEEWHRRTYSGHFIFVIIWVPVVPGVRRPIGVLKGVD